jgi:hypothetical protein
MTSISIFYQSIGYDKFVIELLRIKYIVEFKS